MIITIDGLKIDYNIDGDTSNKPILLLHGWGCDKSIFDCIINALKDKMCVYSLDFPGFGNSGMPPDTFGVYEYTELIAKFIKELKIEKPDIICHSFGGRIAIVLCAIYPELISKVVFTDAAGLIKKRTLKYYFKVYSYKLLKKLGFKQKKAGSSDYRALSEDMKQVFVRVVNEDLTKYLPQIKAPSLLIYGENDEDTPVYFGEKMEKLIPDSGLVVLKNAGHYSFLDDFYTYIKIVRTFLGV